MRVAYEWHLEKVMPNSIEIINGFEHYEVEDFDFADTLNELLKHYSKDKITKMLDAKTHKISIQKHALHEGDLGIEDYAYVLPNMSIVASKYFGVLPKRFQKELDRYYKGGK